MEHRASRYQGICEYCRCIFRLSRIIGETMMVFGMLTVDAVTWYRTHVKSGSPTISTLQVDSPEWLNSLLSSSWHSVLYIVQDHTGSPKRRIITLPEQNVFFLCYAIHHPVDEHVMRYDNAKYLVTPVTSIHLRRERHVGSVLCGPSTCNENMKSMVCKRTVWWV